MHQCYTNTNTYVSKQFARILLLDLSKAFHLINHNILLEKFASVGLPNILTKRIASFLTERKEQVKLCYTASGWNHIHGGVPQGTNLGPVLFVLVINDIQTACDSYKCVDDTCIVYTGCRHPDVYTGCRHPDVYTGSDTHTSTLVADTQTSTLDADTQTSTLDADTQTSTLVQTPRRLHWLQTPRRLHWIRHPDVYTGSDTKTSPLDQTPICLHWIRHPDVYTGSDTQTSTLDQTPRRLQWIRHPDVYTGSDT